jgi:polyhydroxybutyrate depolymerase
VLKRIFKIEAALVVLVVMAVAAAAWWFLSSDSMDPPELAGVMEPGSLEHKGRARSWQAYIPSSVADSPPVVLVLHGSRGDGQRMMQGTRYGFNLLAEREGFIPVYPHGFEKHWNDCRGSANYSANTENIDDVGFLKALTAELVQRHNVDLSQVYVTGMSNGGQMAYRMGLEAPEFVAGIAAIAASLPVEENLDCEPLGQPVKVMVMNGTEDPVNPYQGGLVEITGDASRGMVRSSEETVLYWAQLAGYRGVGEPRRWPDRDPGDGTSVESETWSDTGKAEVALISIIGGGHTIPHSELSMPRIIGPTSHEFDAAELIWAFFSGENYLSE